MRQEELLEEESSSLPKVVARELANHMRQAIPMLAGYQTAPVTPQIQVTAQEEQTEHVVDHSSSSASRSASLDLEDRY